MQIYNASGNIVDINLSDLAYGAYIARILTDNNKIHTEKIKIIQ